ncbi:hypothetical protein V492_03019, partial [Pseudogymnoascus sp. VKM F-4246]
MDQIPTDIVRVIAGFVDYDDILSFSLTCRSFAAMALPQQFQVIHVTLFRRSLKNLLRISEHPVYRNYVLAIEYEPAFVLNPGTRLQWTGTVNNYNVSLSDPYASPFTLFSESEVEQAYHTHIQYYNDQKRMKATGFRHPLPTWGDAFCNMAKVMRKPECFLQYMPRISNREITACLAAGRLAPMALKGLDCEAFDPGIMGCDEDESGDEDEREDEPGDDYRRRSVRLSRFNSFVRDSTKDLGLPLVYAVFESLTFLRLEFSSEGDRKNGPYQKYLGSAIRAAKGLEELCLDGSEDKLNRFSFNTILGSSTWPHLNDLSLSSFTIRENDLPAFFSRHASLDTFSLYDAFAHDFDWATLLQSSSLEPHLRRLDSISFDGNWGAANWTEISDEDLAGRSHIGDDDAELDRLDDAVNLAAEFRGWAEELAGASDLQCLMRRYYECDPGDAPFPLRTGREILAEVARQKAEGTWVPPNGEGNMIIATERLVGEEYRTRDLYSKYDADGAVVKTRWFWETDESDASSDDG